MMKPIHARWIISLYDRLRKSTKMIMEAFNMTGIAEVVSLEVMEDEDPFAKLQDWNTWKILLMQLFFMLFRLRPKSCRICSKNR